MTTETRTISPATYQRVQRFVFWFVRSQYVTDWHAANDADFHNHAERAARCYMAAEDGADGKTHAEVIQDWREAFDAWIADRHKWQNPDRFMRAVHKYFDDSETWHEQNGSLNQEIG